MTPDAVNALFEFGGAVAVFAHILQTTHDHDSKGVNWLAVVFFQVWGIWNLVYYPALNQPLSFLAGLLLVIVNTVWIRLIIHYRRHHET